MAKNDLQGTLDLLVLKTLDQKFAEYLIDYVRLLVDASVSNASRITKLYGTMTRKGHDTNECPHRRSELIYVPDYLEVPQ